MIDELEKKEQALSQRLAELEASAAAHDPSTVDTTSPDDRHTRSIAASSPATREGASISFIAHLFADANWRKSHAGLLRTLADAPGAGEVSIAPCSLPSAAETQMLFEKYLSWAHIQNPFLLRRSIWALHHRLFSNPNTSGQVTNHDLFRAFMICAIGAVLPYRNRLHDRHPEAYYNAALQYLGTEFLTRGLESVQDLLLICRFGIYHPIGTSIWDVVRLCGRLCIELGLHSNPHIPNDLLQTQLRRRIFWQFYLIDRYSSTTLDRPFLIDDNDISTKFPVEASDEELEAANSQVQSLDSFNFNREPNVQNEMTIFFVSVRLRQISSHIQTEFSKLRGKIVESSPKRNLAGHVHVVMTKLLKELQEWRSSTPIIQEPSCLYEMQEWYDHLLARERLSVLRRAIDLVPKVHGSPPKDILTVFLRSALEAIDRYHILCQARSMLTHTRSYFHMLFTAGLSVMYCTSVSKQISPEDLRASHEGLQRCQELLRSVTLQLPDAKNYVAVFEALLRDHSQRLWPNAREPPMSLPADASVTIPNEVGNFTEGDFPQNLVAGPLPADMDDFTANSQFFEQGLNRPDMLGPVNQFDSMPAENDISSEYQDGTGINWALLNYDSLWNMESALGHYVYGDPSNPGVWEGFEF
ncbi:hypothetical protein LB507_008571 [Fusarium sp. FIESC RH6]|nr:hypothetical protein LB507_008571 [Fusarium sp. FIESC RH6]